MKLRKCLSLLLALACLSVGGRLPARADYNMPYYIIVDITNQVTTVYDTATGGIVRQMLCSTGMKQYTPRGNFILPKTQQKHDRQPWYYIEMFHRYVKYATRIQGMILFHSMPYRRKSLQSIDADAAAQLGLPVSHGCIRLRWQDAKFIAENCLPGTAVQITETGQRDDGLRELLYQQTYDAASGVSYETFLGISGDEDSLGRFSEGPEVLNLQYRLRDLGLYDGELSGTYDSATVNAVRVAQYLLGTETSGVASRELQETLYGPDAPTAMDVTLSEGMSGPAVRALQDDLAILGLYTDAPDSVYDAAVVEAVKQFESAYGYEADGVASPKVQKAADYEAGRLGETFGGGDYDCQWVDEPLDVARVTTGTRLREAASPEARSIRRLSEGQGMIVLEKGGSWSRVRVGEDEGYVRNDLAEFGQRTVSVLRYAAPGGETTYTIGSSAADYYAGAKLPCETFDEYLAANDQTVDVDSLVSYVTVDTQGQAPSLNLRQSPDADAAVLDTVENGSSLRVQRRAGEWTQVAYRGSTGYLMNRYLTFWNGPEDALEDAGDGEEAPEFTVGYAVVQSASGKSAEVYAEDADDAKVLGSLKNGLRVEVLDSWDGWCHIRYEGREGYMIGEDLEIEEPAEEALPAETLLP